MRKLKRFSPSPALVISTIALFVAIGGVAVALPGHNSVKSDDIKNVRWGRKTSTTTL